MEIKKNKLSNQIVRHCAPTLAGIKCGNMFSISCEKIEETLNEIQGLNQCLLNKGIKIIPLRFSKKRCLIYVFRHSALNVNLADEKACKILKDLGYESCNPEKCLEILLKRFDVSKQFPHEIGLFLGYPPEDVFGFIKNKGKHAKISGLWQVYGDEKLALNKFNRFKKCTKIFCEKARKGVSIDKLAIAG